MLNLAIAGFSFGDTVGDNLIPIAVIALLIGGIVLGRKGGGGKGGGSAS